VPSGPSRWAVPLPTDWYRPRTRATSNVSGAADPEAVRMGLTGYDRGMSDDAQPDADHGDDALTGTEMVAAPEGDGDVDDISAMVEQPAKVMRIGTMIKQLLEEVRAAPLDEAGRQRLRDIHETSIRELEEGLSPELRAELDRLSLPFGDGVPSEAELRIAQAQLVGWLEGVFHGIQTALFAQQMAARQQLEQMRHALPGAAGRQIVIGPGGQILGAAPGGQPGEEDAQGRGTGQYL
jgi:hypothetical protein